MGAIFRSEEMALCQLFLQPEAAYASLTILGEKGIVQFRDLNEGINLFQRKYTSEVRRCEEMERKLRYIEQHMVQEQVKITEDHTHPDAPNPREMAELEAKIESTVREISECSSNSISLKLNYLELTEISALLEKTQPFFQERDEGTLRGPNDEARYSGQLGFVAGVIPRVKKQGFERMLWRISRGNVFLRQVDIENSQEDPKTGHVVEKTVFVVFYKGEQLRSRVHKVCTGYHAVFYPCPSSCAERSRLAGLIDGKIADLTLVLNQTIEHHNRVLNFVTDKVHSWIIMVRKMKAVYHTLNLLSMDASHNCFIGECWVPVRKIRALQSALVSGGNLRPPSDPNDNVLPPSDPNYNVRPPRKPKHFQNVRPLRKRKRKIVGSSISSVLNVLHTAEEPPTFYRTNKFTYGFHALIESYGTATYREVNPGLYTIITFPFLFAVMFGDAGHGLILFIFAAFMVYKEEIFMEKKSSNEIWNMLFGGRYIILLMGLFSMYTGLIYNDVFSKMPNIFGTHWSFNFTVEDFKEKDLQLNPVTQYAQDPYWFGVDPVWQVASNKIVFLNSFKMKLSIIIGVLHMIFGIFLSTINQRYFGKSVYIILQWLPEVLFLILLFVYLCVLMFYKWIFFGPPDEKSIFCAPSVLITFINMMLLKKTTNDANGKYAECDPYMFPYQNEVQMTFVGLAMLCIPAMLLGKPLYLLFCRGRKNGYKWDGEEEEEEEEPASEIWIHQAIHTVEYVLSTISHTASYLRLWALSLAHAQLSEVLWQMVFHRGLAAGIPYYGGIIIFVFFFIWAAGTMAILIMMEGLSAFLHTLRLHWVEFCSKFYIGNGYAFVPFSFQRTFINYDCTDV